MSLAGLFFGISVMQKFLFTGAVLITAFSVNANLANLLNNGSFEHGSFTPPREDGVVQLFNGSSAISGWVVFANGAGLGGDIAWESASNPWQFKPSDGDKFIDLTGYDNDTRNPHGGISLAQNVALTPGQTYSLGFDMGSSRFYDNQINPMVSVTVNGVPQQMTFTGNNTTANDASEARNHWERFTYSFVADGGNAVVKFVGVTPKTQRVLLLDNVSLAVVPEPSTVVAASLLLLPFALSTLPRFRRRAAVASAEKWN